MSKTRPFGVALFVVAVLLLAYAPSMAQVCGPGTSAPQCDGQCPSGLACAESGASCACLPLPDPCEAPGNPNGPPMCWGLCPHPSMVCATFAGGCACLPAPTPTPTVTPSPTPTPILCGNGTTDPGEQCDDGDMVNGNGCDNNCTLTGCGNGIATSGEECDASDDAACPGACLSDCTCAVCGDNLTEGPEECDGTDDTACPDDCRPDCTCFVGIERPIPGKKLLLKDGIVPEKRKIVFLAKSEQIDVTGTGFDPTVTGATLQLFNGGGSGESTCIPLPASGWLVKGTPPALVYKYKDAFAANGPCKVALLKNLKLLKVVCKAKLQPIAYSLDEAAQGSMAVRFTSGDVSFCALFGGFIKADSGTDPPNPGGKGQFKAKDASPPPVCPPPPVPCP